MSSMDIGRLVGYVELDDSGVAEGAQSAKDRLTELGSSGAALTKAAGLGMGLALAGGLVASLDVEAANAKLSAQLDLSASESERLGGVAGRLYSGAYGESMGDVNDALRSVIQNVEGMGAASDAELEGITGKVLSVSQAFDQDLGGVTKAVGQLMRTGLATDAEHALDIITAGMQNGVNASDDWLDTLNEYSTQFRELGISGEEALGLISQGMQAGARDSDVVADALKELVIRARDGSQTTRDAFEALGLSGAEMGARFAAGGDSAREALDVTLDRLRNLEDPAARSAAAVGLLGTQSEDLAGALFSMDLTSAAEGLDSVEGAAGRVDAKMGGTLSATIDTLTRRLQSFATDAVGPIAPALGELVSSGLDVLTPPLEIVGGLVSDLVGFLGGLPGPVLEAGAVLAGLAAFRGPLTSAFDSLKSTAAGALESVQLRAMYARDAINGAGGGVAGAFSAAGSAASGAARGGLAAAAGVMGGPLGLAIAGITLGLPVLSGLFSDNSDEAAAAARENSNLADALRETGGAIDETVRAAAAKDLEDRGLLATAKQLGIDIGTVTDAALGNAEALELVRAATEAVMQETLKLNGYNTEDAGFLGQMEAAQGLTAGLEELAPIVAETAASEQRLAEATAGTTTATDGQAEASAVAAGAAEDQAAAVDELKDALDRYLGVGISVAEAQLDVADGLAALAESTTANGTSLDRSTQAGRDNERAVLDQITAIADLSQASLDAGASVDEVKNAHQRETQALRDKLVELGYNAAEVDTLIAKYGTVPDEVWTTVTQPGMPEAHGAADVLRDKVLAVPNDKTVITSALTAEAIAKLEALGYKVTHLEDGTVRVEANTDPAATDLASFINQRRTITVGVTYALPRGGAPVQYGTGLASGGLVKAYAAGGIELSPMSAGIAQIVPPNTWRVVGDRIRDDEFYIPDDEAPRSLALGAEWARRRGYGLVPLAHYADGGIAAAGTAREGLGGAGARYIDRSTTHVYAQVDAARLAAELEALRRDREHLDAY